MSAYLISGSSGSGKSTVGRVLQERGFRVVETDFEDGLSGWFEVVTGERVADVPPQPYTDEWFKRHTWRWGTDIMQKLLKSASDEAVFFCGGAYNEDEFYDSFDKIFRLYAPREVVSKRLKQREPERWVNGSVEMNQVLDWNDMWREHSQKIGAIAVDSSSSPEFVADEILKYVQI